MFGRLSKIWRLQRRRRAFAEARRQSADSGYALDDLSDSELESAITRGGGGIETSLPLTGKTIYWALRRLSPDSRQLQRRKIKQPPQGTVYF